MEVAGIHRASSSTDAEGQATPTKSEAPNAVEGMRLRVRSPSAPAKTCQGCPGAAAVSGAFPAAPASGSFTPASGEASTTAAGGGTPASEGCAEAVLAGDPASAAFAN